MLLIPKIQLNLLKLNKPQLYTNEIKKAMVKFFLLF